MKLSTRLKLILPLFTVAQLISAPKALPKRSAEQILFVACAKGVEACGKCNLGVDCNGQNIAAIANALKSNDQFEDAQKLDKSILANLSESEKEVAIIGFVTLLMVKGTGIALKSAVDAAELFVQMPNSPKYFQEFVNTVKAVKDMEKANQAGDILNKLVDAKDILPNTLKNHLEVIEQSYGFSDANAKLNAILALVRNNKNY